jgi:hypothetical protein
MTNASGASPGQDVANNPQLFSTVEHHATGWGEELDPDDALATGTGTASASRPVGTIAQLADYMMNGYWTSGGEILGLGGAGGLVASCQHHGRRGRDREYQVRPRRQVQVFTSSIWTLGANDVGDARHQRELDYDLPRDENSRSPS